MESMTELEEREEVVETKMKVAARSFEYNQFANHTGN